MKKLKVLKNVLHNTKADKILVSYLIFVLLDAVFIWLVDPSVKSYVDSLWYCCSTISTAGYGDVVVTSFIGKIATVALMIYSILVVAIITGVVVNFYNQLIKIRQNGTIAEFVDKLERLPELSQEELADLSEKVIQFQKRRQ